MTMKKLVIVAVLLLSVVGFWRRDTTSQQIAQQERKGVPPVFAWHCPSTHPIKGNFTPSSGERCIAHLPGGQFYDKTKPEMCHEFWFESNQGQARRCRQASKLKTWKRDAERFECSFKYGLYESFRMDTEAMLGR